MESSEEGNASMDEGVGGGKLVPREVGVDETVVDGRIEGGAEVGGRLLPFALPLRESSGEVPNLIISWSEDGLIPIALVGVVGSFRFFMMTTSSRSEPRIEEVDPSEEGKSMAAKVVGEIVVRSVVDVALEGRIVGPEGLDREG